MSNKDRFREWLKVEPYYMIEYRGTESVLIHDSRTEESIEVKKETFKKYLDLCWKEQA